MKKLKIFKISCLLFIVLVACDKKDDELKVSADVVFLKKEISGEVRYGTAYSLQGNQGLDSVTVTVPISGEVVKLKQNATSTYLFEYEPKNENFTNIAPYIGDYLFKVASKKGERLEVIEDQRFDDLAFAVINETGFDDDNLWLYVKWGKVSGADAYATLLFKLSGEAIFSSFTIPAFTDEEYEYKISDFHITGSWNEKPQKDQKYILRVNAIKYDSDTGKDEYFNIQEISATDREIIWEFE